MNYKVFKILRVKKTYVMRSWMAMSKTLVLTWIKSRHLLNQKPGDFIQIASIDGSNKHHARIIKRGDVKTDFNVIGGSND